MPADPIAEALAAFATDVPLALSETTRHAAQSALLDTLAVSLGALGHPAAQAARRYAAALGTGTQGCVIWGTRARANPELAALVNGVPLRAYDYNDLYIGKRTGGHPSDIIPGLLAVAEWTNASGRDFLSAVALGYDVVLHLFDTLPLKSGGWDYPNITALGATCAMARLFGLTSEQTQEAVSITVASHMASDELESGDLNRRGDLTMWKRFNGGDAMRQSIYACLLASVGVEGTVRPFVGKSGLLSKLGQAEGVADAVIAQLDRHAPLSRAAQVTFKRWPVGSRAQSAIQAALAARAQVASVDAIAKVRVFADVQAYEHLVARRDDPWHPYSRETADHSLPYIVAAAVFDGRLHADSFEPERVQAPELQAFLGKVEVRAEPALSRGAAGGFPTRVEIETVSGEVFTGAEAPPPGHPANPFDDRFFEEKLEENAGALLGKAGVASLVQAVWSLHEASDVRQLASLLVMDEPSIA